MQPSVDSQYRRKRSSLTGSPSSEARSAVRASHVPSIDASTAVGITFSITFIMAFSLGVLVTMCVSKTRPKTTSPHPFTPCALYEVVGINQKKMMS
eukprot:Em0006g91a